MSRSFKTLLTSKKFIMTVTGIVMEIVIVLLPEGTLKPELQENLMWLIGALILVAVGGQALADRGKEAAKIEAASKLGGATRREALSAHGVHVPPLSDVTSDG